MNHNNEFHTEKTYTTKYLKNIRTVKRKLSFQFPNSFIKLKPKVKKICSKFNRTARISENQKREI